MADQENNPKAESGGSKMLLVALAVTNLLSLGGLAYFVVMGGGDQASAGIPQEVSEPEAPQEVVEVGPTVDIGTFSITLADPGQNRYLKAILKARVSANPVMEEVEGREPEIRDRVIDYLSSLTVKETQGAAAKSTIRSNLKKRINNILRSGEVENIFLTEFVTQ